MSIKSKTFTLQIKDGCDVCEDNLRKIKAYIFDKPHKYGNRMIVTFNQDWLGGDVLHIDAVEFGNYELKTR